MIYYKWKLMLKIKILIFAICFTFTPVLHAEDAEMTQFLDNLVVRLNRIHDIQSLPGMKPTEDEKKYMLLKEEGFHTLEDTDYIEEKIPEIWERFDGDFDAVSDSTKRKSTIDRLVYYLLVLGIGAMLL